MKLFRCDKNDSDMGTMLSWHASKREAEVELRRHQKERGGDSCGPESVTAVDIPTDKAGLLKWLNIEFKNDNG